MSLEAESKVFKHKKAETLYLTIPAKLANDSSFPFNSGDKVKLEIENEKLKVKTIDQ